MRSPGYLNFPEALSIMRKHLGGEVHEALGKEIDLITVRSLEEPPKFSTDVSFRKTVNEERVELYAA